MAIICPQCSYANPDDSGFCVRCGSRLQSNPQSNSSQQLSTSSTSTLPSRYEAPYSSSTTPSAGYSAQHAYQPAAPSASQPGYSAPPTSTQSGFLAPPAAPTASQSGYSTPFAASTASQPGYSAPPTGSLYPSSVPAYNSQAFTQMGAGQGVASLRRAFAGHGTLVMHYSWLLNGDQEKVAPIRTAIEEMLKLRAIPGINVKAEKLMERGLLMESRDYLVVQRGVSSVFIYVSPAGRDLYISRATNVLPSISNVRVALLILALLIMFLGFVIHPSPYSLLAGDVLGFILASTFTALSVPILLILIVLLIRSIITWLVEKDFWQFLRPNTLNDFQLDDIALMEHVTDDVVRSAAKQVGLDASQISTPPQGYQPKRRIRAI